MFNSNLIHNIINTLIALIAALAVFDWSQFFEPQTAIMVAGGLALAKIVINVFRDGFKGLAKNQPPVQ